MNPLKQSAVYWQVNTSKEKKCGSRAEGGQSRSQAGIVTVALSKPMSKMTTTSELMLLAGIQRQTRDQLD
jgi:aspartyl aminopeptidase